MNRSETPERPAVPTPRRRGLPPRVEGLEQRALLATSSTTFTAPDISDLIRGAQAGIYTAPAAVNRMLGALRAQLQSGPLADLNNGTVDQAGFITEVSSLVQSFDQGVDAALLPRHPNVDNIIKLQATAAEANLTALSAQTTAGLNVTTPFATLASDAIDAINFGPLRPFGTTLSGLASRTQTFETDLSALGQRLTATTSPLTLAQAGVVYQAESAAYKAQMDASLYGHPFSASIIDSAVTNLNNQVSAIAANTSLTTAQAQTQLQSAVAAFDAVVLDTTGLFGPRGLIARLQSDSD